MDDKKHIDRLFQERFKDFEATPSDAVWENIEAQLNKKKKKRRVIPIWWRYAGVAALLLLLLTIGGRIYFSTEEGDVPVNTVVETEDDINTITPKPDTNTLVNESNKSETVTTNNNDQESLERESKAEKASDKITPSKEASIAETTSPKLKNEGERVINPNLNKKSTITNPLIKTEKNTAIVSNTKENNSKNVLNTSKNNTAITSTKTNDNEAIKHKDTVIDSEKASDIIKDASKTNTAIAQNNNNTTNANSDFETGKNELPIKDDINKDIIEEEKKSNRWSIAPNAAPVYFNSLGEGSSIDPQFNSNSKSSELNMSYGIKASYAINKKLSVRTGVNKVNLGYNTNNIVAFQSIGIRSNAIALQNVAPNNQNNVVANNISLISAESLVSDRRPESFTTTSNASLNQSLGYIEVPLEIQYALINKKLGVNVIGGFSSFFLSDNKIFSETEGAKTFIGKANNINDVSYSANFGLGLNYKFSKKIDLNLEPMFKYQINTFNNTSGDFKPYFIGVYTGFAIKF